MRILLYGFEPFNDYKTNISEEVARAVGEKFSIPTIIFPVTFTKNTFLKPIRHSKADCIIGLGQYPTGSHIRIERKAVNMRKGKRHPGPIVKNGPTELFVNMKLPKIPGTIITYDAGTHACNFSMYLMCLEAKQRDLLSAFLHIPKDFPVKKAISMIERLITPLASGLSQ
jgi:pyrrolidone-carboxylate peptidase